MNNSSLLSRRSFLQKGCCSAVGMTGILSTLAQLRVIGAVGGDAARSTPSAKAVPDGYKALVCLYLSGGNDTDNVLVPYDTASHLSYTSARGELAVPRANLRPIGLKSYSDGRSYGLHPSIPEIHELYSSGKLAFMANVGTLIQPTNRAQYLSGRNLPPHLFSHIDQQMQWQSSLPETANTTGWGGRLADLVNAMNENNQISMSLSLSGVNLFQRGNSVNQISVGTGFIPQLSYGEYNEDNSVGGTPGVFQSRRLALYDILSAPQQHLMNAAFGQTMKNSIDDARLLATVLNSSATLATAFPTTPTGQRLAMVAKMMSVASALGLRRQIFFVQLLGFDTHGGQAAAHPPLLAQLSASLGAFYKATVELGIESQVTTFTASDFGRTYVPNLGGTDHGWGSHQMIMGGAVQGGDIYGRLPSFTIDAPDDTGRGRWIPSTSVDEYHATLARWFGVSETNLPIVLPNIGRFISRDLGFLKRT